MTTQPLAPRAVSPGLVLTRRLHQRYCSALPRCRTSPPHPGGGHAVPASWDPTDAGKTTLLKILAGVLSDYEGSVTIDGHHPGPASQVSTRSLPSCDADFLNPNGTRTAVKEYSRLPTSTPTKAAAMLIPLYGFRPDARPPSE